MEVFSEGRNLHNKRMSGTQEWGLPQPKEILGEDLKLNENSILEKEEVV